MQIDFYFLESKTARMNNVFNNQHTFQGVICNTPETKSRGKRQYALNVNKTKSRLPRSRAKVPDDWPQNFAVEADKGTLDNTHEQMSRLRWRAQERRTCL